MAAPLNRQALMALLPRGREGLSGLMEGVTLPELVQMACLEGKERAIHLFREGEEGVVYCARGDVVHAEAGGREGVEAFFALVRWREALFHYIPAPPPRRTITAPYNFLLIEASRLMDEGGQEVGGDRPRREAIRLLIVDDSELVCRMLSAALEEHLQEVEILTASNGKEALALLGRSRPHLVTLDMNMPVMDGDIALKHIMIRSPAPVVLVSGLGNGAMPRAMEFLRLGAIDFIPKPEAQEGVEEVAGRIARLARRARALRVENARRARRAPPGRRKLSPTSRVEGVAIFVGGVGSLLEVAKVVPHLPGEPEIAVVFLLDVVERLVPPLAAELDRLSPFHVRPIQDTEALEGGAAAVVPLSMAVEVCKDGECWRLSGSGEGDAVSALVRSCARSFGAGCALFVLSGGEVPQEAVEELVSRGGRMLIQDPSSSIDQESILRVKAMELEDGLFQPESVAVPMEAWRTAFRHAVAGNAGSP